MLKKLVVVFILLITNKFVHAQIDTTFIKQVIKTQSDSMFAAFKRQDWETFSNYMHPDIIKLVKGKAAFIDLLNAEMGNLKSLQFTQLIQVGNIQVVKVNKTMQCVVQYGLGMSMDSSLISGVSSSIGESTDNGQTWKFVRNTAKNFDELKTLLPWVSYSLKIPKEEQKFGISLDDFLKTYNRIYLAGPKKGIALKRKYSIKKT